MKDDARETGLVRDLGRLFQSMDFVSRHPALQHNGPQARRFGEIYQQPGVAWEFLALQCPHRGGWRRLRDGKSASSNVGHKKAQSARNYSAFELFVPLCGFPVLCPTGRSDH
jgi:hypothetical protein